MSQDKNASEYLLEVCRLSALEAEVKELRAEEAELEVGQITARADIEALPEWPIATLDKGAALVLGGLLAKSYQQHRESEILAGSSASGLGKRRTLVAGREALQLWLVAIQTESPNYFLLVKGVILVFTLIAIVLAFVVHPAMLLLLIPIFVPVTLLFRRGDNALWRRLGAKQAFERTGLPALSNWNEERVRERLEEIERSLAEGFSQQEREIASMAESTWLPSPEIGDSQYLEVQPERENSNPGALSARGPSDTSVSVNSIEQATQALLDTEQAIEGFCAEQGLDERELSPERREGLRRQFEREEDARVLRKIRHQREAKQAEAEAIRHEVFQFLSRERGAFLNGRADVQTLRSELRKLVNG